MQYVRSGIGAVSKTWNSLNPATLSGAIDVIVIEQEDGTLSCSPFHVRFGKFSLLRPSEKRVEFKVNDVRQPYSMKLGEGGEAFFVFETSEDIPEALQTSPLVSPAQSPAMHAVTSDRLTPTGMNEPSYLDIASSPSKQHLTPPGSPGLQKQLGTPPIVEEPSSMSDDVFSTSVPHTHHSSTISGTSHLDSRSSSPSPAMLPRSASEEHLPTIQREHLTAEEADQLQKAAPKPILIQRSQTPDTIRPKSPPSLEPKAAKARAMTLSHKLSSSNIKSTVTDSGDLMLDITGYKAHEADALRAEVIARKILSDELEGDFDIGSLIGTDERGNLWIYSSEEAKDAANRKAAEQATAMGHSLTNDTISDPGYHSDDGTISDGNISGHRRVASDVTPDLELTRPSIDSSRNYAKTLRLTSDQLKELKLKSGTNSVSFTVNKATCKAHMYLWSSQTPIVISDIDGTITKSDALGHVLNMIGRDWTHVGVAKLYSEIIQNGYNIFYLTSRSVGQADTTRAYLDGVTQDGQKLPKGPVILSPDRTVAALRREIYLRKPELFKMACLRDILSLFPGRTNPFYAGFGNRFTDALSYRTVNIPSTRIFTINSNAEVSLDLLSLNRYKQSYVSMQEVVDHFFPPVATLLKEGAEGFTDFNYWRDTPENLDNFSATDSDSGKSYAGSIQGEDVMEESYVSTRDSMDQESAMSMSIQERDRDSIEQVRQSMESSMIMEDAMEDFLTEEYVERDRRPAPSGNGKPLKHETSAPEPVEE